MSAKVLCDNSALVCELHEEGLFIHVFGDTIPSDVADLLSGCDVKVYYLNNTNDDVIIGYLVYPRYVLFAMEQLLDEFDLVIQ